MECEHVRACLHGFATAPRPEEVAALESHLAACEACAALADSLGDVRRALAGFVVPEAPATDPEDIRRRVARRRAPVPLGPWIGWGLAAALAVMALFPRWLAPAPEPARDVEQRLGALEEQLARLERRHREDLRALALSLDVSRQETEQRTDQDLERLRGSLEQELRLARGAMAELVDAVAPGLSRALATR